MNVKLEEVNGQVWLPVPASICASAGLVPGQTVSVAVRDGVLLVDPRPRYDLAELVAQCDPAAPRAPEQNAWLNIKPIGLEVR